MKKLMFALVAAGAAAVMAADAIESGAVGFAKSDVNSAGMCPVGVAFKNINGGDFEVTDSLFGQTLVDDDQVWTLNFENGDWDMYSYNSTDGWTAILSDGSIQSNLASIPSIKKGEGCYFLPADWETPAIVSGELEGSGEKQLVFATEDGSDVAYQFVNPFPVDTTFGEFEAFMSPDDQVFILNVLNGDWDMYVYNGEGSWTAIMSDGEITDINEDNVKNYKSTVLLEANRAAWFLPAWNWDTDFPQERIFKSIVNY